MTKLFIPTLLLIIAGIVGLVIYTNFIAPKPAPVAPVAPVAIAPITPPEGPKIFADLAVKTQAEPAVTTNWKEQFGAPKPMNAMGVNDVSESFRVGAKDGVQVGGSSVGVKEGVVTGRPGVMQAARAQQMGGSIIGGIGVMHGNLA